MSGFFCSTFAYLTTAFLGDHESDDEEHFMTIRTTTDFLTVILTAENEKENG
jgi:hypothetical protein